MFSEKTRLEAARKIFSLIAEKLDASFSIRLWDGSLVPLGRHSDPNYYLSIKGPEVLTSVLRRPTLENILRHYAAGRIDVHGGDLIEFARKARENRPKLRFKDLNKPALLKAALPLLFGPGEKARVEHQYADDETGRKQAERSDKEFVRFHYDLSNEFYALFLDPEMQYSCAYFTDRRNSLEQAQLDKLEMICRKLRLTAGDRFLDIGCGWGGLVCYAARRYGVEAHGVTLSRKQYDYALEKVDRLGLGDRVRIELRDYTALDGQYDKIASIGMFEHVGIANHPTYFRKIHSLLRDRGILLNHAISRRAKSKPKKFHRIRPEKKLILKYIFPGSELDHIGHSLEMMESCGFEVRDVESWREHYAETCRRWCRRLMRNEGKAIEHVGLERYRMWTLYLAGVSFAFEDGSLRIYQTVATKHRSKGPSGFPPTREHLCRLTKNPPSENGKNHSS